MYRHFSNQFYVSYNHNSAALNLKHNAFTHVAFLAASAAFSSEMPWHSGFRRVNSREYLAGVAYAEARTVCIASKWCYLWAGLESEVEGLFARSPLGVECTYWLLQRRYRHEVALTRWQRRCEQLFAWWPFFAGVIPAPVAIDGWVGGDDDSEDEDLWCEDEIYWHRRRVGV